MTDAMKAHQFGLDVHLIVKGESMDHARAAAMDRFNEWFCEISQERAPYPVGSLLYFRFLDSKGDDHQVTLDLLKELVRHCEQSGVYIGPALFEAKQHLYDNDTYVIPDDETPT